MGTILSRLKGRKVEIQEYMKKMADPRNIVAQMDAVFASLKKVPLNPRLLQLSDDISQTKEPETEEHSEEGKDFEVTNYIPQYDTLFSFVNSEQVEELKLNALKNHGELEAKKDETIASLDKHTTLIEEPLDKVCALNAQLAGAVVDMHGYSGEIAEDVARIES